jgi:hypothetical protein
MHTSHIFPRKLRQFSGRRDANAADWFRRNKGVVGRSCFEYAPKGRNHRQIWEEKYWAWNQGDA